MLIPFFILLLSALSCPAQEHLFVVQQLDESLGSIDLATHNVTPHAVTLGNLPNDLSVREDKIYVTNSGYNNIQEIDVASMTTIREIQISGGINPWSLCFLNNDSIAVTNFVTGNVSVIRLSDEQVVADLPVGPAPEGILAHGDHFYVCVTGVEWPVFGSSYISVFNRTTLERVDSLPVGTNAQYAAIDAMNRLHVVCTGDYANVTGEVHVIDLSTRESEIVNVGGTPSSISIGGGFAYLAAGGWGSDGFVHRYRLSDLAVTHDATSPLRTAPGASDVEAFPDGSFFVSCFADDVIEYRSTDGSLIRTYEVSDGPGQMTIDWGTSTSPRTEFPVTSSVFLTRTYPNPFNSSVRIELNTPLNRSHYINIYNMMGQAVRRLRIPFGTQSATWNADDNYGYSVSSGTYIAIVEANPNARTKQLIYIK